MILARFLEQIGTDVSLDEPVFRMRSKLSWQCRNSGKSAQATV